MSDFEKYVPAAAKAIRETPWKRTTFWEDENGIPVDEGDPRAVHQDHMSSEDYDAEARAVLEIVGPLIAEDTRERMVAAAARAVERETPSLYYCPASGEVEQKPGGGFDACCDQPGQHQPLSEAAYRAIQTETAKQIMEAIERRRLGRRRRWFRSRRWSAEAESAWSSGMWQAAGIAHRQGRDARSKAAS